MQIDSILTGIAVSDVDAAADYYERLFGRPGDARPMPGLIEWHLPAGVVQVASDPDRAGRSMVSLVVGDLETALVELSERGISPTTNPQAGDTVSFSVLNDPEGTQIVLVQV